MSVREALRTCGLIRVVDKRSYSVLYVYVSGNATLHTTRADKRAIDWDALRVMNNK